MTNAGRADPSHRAEARPAAALPGREATPVEPAPVRAAAAGAPLRPAQVLGLQRRIGNRAVAAILRAPKPEGAGFVAPVPVRAAAPGGRVQRAPVAPANFLQAIVAAGAADPEWDPQWTAALHTVRVAPEFTGNAPATVDDANEASILGLIGVLNALKQLSSARPNPYRAAIEAIRWHAGIETDSGGSGFGSLDTSGPPFSGRPAFPSITQTNVPLKGGQHRRHILAWHQIRDFVSLTYAAQPQAVVGAILRAFNAPADLAVADAIAEAHKHVESARAKSHAGPGVLSHEEVLKVGLFVMNGNPRNLWAGKGSTNSAINTAQMHMNTALDGVTTFAALAGLAATWKNAQGKEIYRTATTLGANVLIAEGSKAHERFALANGATPEATLVAEVVEKVRQYVTSNLELDVVGDVKAQTEIAQDKAAALREPIAIIDHVARGVVNPAVLDPKFIDIAIGEFLTYMK